MSIKNSNKSRKKEKKKKKEGEQKKTWRTKDTRPVSVKRRQVQTVKNLAVY